MIRFCIAPLAMALATPAVAQVIDVSSSKANIGNWQISEVSRGQLVTQPAHFVGKTHFGQIPGMTFRVDRSAGFGFNDGYWYAATAFTLPEGAANPALHITGLGVDDRAVVELNGQIVTNAGDLEKGKGFMTFTDGGANEPYKFTNIAGPQNVTVTSGFVAGANSIVVIVNNTGKGIKGAPTTKKTGGATSVGLRARVTYTTG